MKKQFIVMLTLALILTACGAKSAPTEAHVEEPHVEGVATMAQNNSAQPAESTAIPNNSGIEGVLTFPDRVEYHDHVEVVKEPEGNLPPVFGEHFAAWQNCGIYIEPVDLGNALHSMEHGAVWVTYRSDLDAAKIKSLQDLARGHKYVLLTPYAKQTSDVVLTAWGVQLVIDSFPDDRAAKFIAYYKEGPQNPEPGAPCDGAIGNPLQ